MADVLISLGSCSRPAVHIAWGTERLSVLLSCCRRSRRIWTPDVKGGRRWYLNQLVAASTDMPVDQLQQLLKQMEAETGRAPGSVTLDADLLLYDGRRYHETDWTRPYVQLLLDDMGM